LTLVMNGIILFFGLVMLWILVDSFFINQYWAKIITNAITFIINYLTRSIFFRKG
jgi:putative flippase GtrA